MDFCIKLRNHHPRSTDLEVSFSCIFINMHAFAFHLHRCLTPWPWPLIIIIPKCMHGAPPNRIPNPIIFLLIVSQFKLGGKTERKQPTHNLFFRLQRKHNPPRSPLSLYLKGLDDHRWSSCIHNPLMEDEKEGDIRVPLVFAIFCLLVTAGGLLLVIYVFAPSLSHPWYPTIAILLVASPWVFWFLTYLYTCIKACFFHPSTAADNPRQVSRRPTTRNAQNGHRQDSARSSIASSKEPEMPLAYSVWIN